MTRPSLLRRLLYRAGVQLLHWSGSDRQESWLTSYGHYGPIATPHPRTPLDWDRLALQRSAGDPVLLVTPESCTELTVEQSGRVRFTGGHSCGFLHPGSVVQVRRGRVWGADLPDRLATVASVTASETEGLYVVEAWARCEALWPRPGDAGRRTTATSLGVYAATA